MYRYKSRLRKSPLILVATIFFIGCGGGGSSQKSANVPAQTTEKNLRMSTYINKGNFVDVAGFAYRKATDPSFAKYAMNIMLPGNDESEMAKPSAYNITSINVDNKLKKIIVQNYQNTLEVKIVDSSRVNILFKDANFTVDRQMSFNDFIAQQ